MSEWSSSRNLPHHWRNMKSMKSGWSSIRWPYGLPKSTSSVLFASDWSCKTRITYWNKWRSWCIMCMSCLKYLLPGKNVMWISLEVAPNVASQTRCDFLIWLTMAGNCDLQVHLYTFRFPEFVQKALNVVSWFGAFLPGKFRWNCHWVRTSDLVAK